MAVRIGVGLSTLPDPLEAGSEAGATAAGGLEGAEADLAIVFLAGRPLAAPEATLEGVSEALGAEVLIGCGAGGVLARGRTADGSAALLIGQEVHDTVRSVRSVAAASCRASRAPSACSLSRLAR